MAQFLELGFDEYNADEQLKTSARKTVCVCCLAQNVPLVHLGTCKHSGFLEFYFKFKMDIQSSFMCYHCHGTLMKIDAFMRQIQDSYIILNEKAYQFKTGTSKLQCTQLEIISLDPSVEDNGAIKMEVCTSKYQESSIKQEHYDLDVGKMDKKEVKQTSIKREKKDAEESYVGKLLITILSEEEMENEREKQRTEDKYLKRPFKCEKCIVAFDHEINLKNHVEQKHRESCGGFVCKICESVYDNDTSLKSHIRRHYTRFKCKICDKRYIDERSAILHYREKHANGLRLYKCAVEYCDFETQSHRSYRYHQARHNQVPCTYCGKLYIKGTQLRLHIKQVRLGLLERAAGCRHDTTADQTYCIITAGARAHRQTRTNVHNKCSSFKCDQCDKQYKQRSGLSVHMRSAHGACAAGAAGESEGDSISYCTTCARQFRSPQTLARHRKQHSTHCDKKYMCDECGARFVTKGNLKYHIEWAHLKMATYKCTQCTKVLRTSRSLRRHIEFIHENKQLPRDKICDYCGKGFTSASYLRTHVRSHTGERPHACSRCGAAFAHRAALYTHRKRHTHNTDNKLLS